MRRMLMLAVVIVAAACAPSTDAPASITAPAPSTNDTAATIGARSESSPTAQASVGVGACETANPVSQHQAPDLEAVLPAKVVERPLTRWSLRGRCWAESIIPSWRLDGLIAEINGARSSEIDLSHLAHAVAGRSDTTADPPFFVFGALRPRDADEIGLALLLLFSGSGFHDVDKVVTGDLSGFVEQTVGGKQVLVGSADMLDQDEHQRGRPYLYQTDEYMFIVITDDDAWAADAIGQLPG